MEQPTLDGIPPLPRPRGPGRPTKQDAKDHAAAVRKAVMAVRPAGKKRGAERAEIAGDHADREHSDWRTRACTLALEYGRTVGSAGFLMEEARVYAEGQGLSAPPDKRAWGNVTQRLKVGEPGKRIERCGMDTDAYGSPKWKWRVV